MTLRELKKEAGIIEYTVFDLGWDRGKYNGEQAIIDLAKRFAASQVDRVKIPVLGDYETFKKGSKYDEGYAEATDLVREVKKHILKQLL